MEIKQIRMGIVGAGTWGRTHASNICRTSFCRSGSNL